MTKKNNTAVFAVSHSQWMNKLGSDIRTNLFYSVLRQQPIRIETFWQNIKRPLDKEAKK